jgi:hypothetical protein
MPSEASVDAHGGTRFGSLNEPAHVKEHKGGKFYHGLREAAVRGSLPLGAGVLVDGERAGHLLVSYVLEVGEGRLRDQTQFVSPNTSGSKRWPFLGSAFCVPRNARVPSAGRSL